MDTSSQPPKPLAYAAAPLDTGWQRWVPGLRMARQYRLAWLPKDLVAGLVLTAMLVPVGIAYAQASGVPGIHGLYATIIPLLAYALFGPSRILGLGPDSALVPIILAVVLPLAAGDPGRAVTLAAAMALVSGLICVSAGLLRLGFITELLSKPIRYGYMNGIALAVLVSQAPKLFGISGQSTGPLRDTLQLLRALLDGKANWHAFALGAGTLAIILLLKRWERLPGILIAVVAATLVSGLLGLEAAHAVKVVGSLPEGLPGFQLPLIDFNDLVTVVIGGAAVALVSFADTSVLSRTYAAKTRTQVDPNQEMIGLGMANLATSFFQGIPISSSSSRTPVAEAAGARSQLAGVFGALGVALLLLLAPDLLRHLRRAPWRRWSSPQRSGCSSSRTWRGSIASSAGSSGCPSPVSSVWRCLAPCRASALRWSSRCSSFSGTAGGRITRCLAGSMASVVTMTCPAIPMPAGCPGWCCSAGMRRCSSPTPSCSSAACWRRLPARVARCGGWWSRLSL